MDITIPYYEDKSRISNSNIGWFLNKGPAYLHKMLTEDVPEEKNPVLERGTMIHEYILQPEEFQKDYVVWNKSRPSSAQQEKFCQELAFSAEIEPNKAVLSAYKEAYSTAGKSEDKMLSEGLKIASTLKDYIDFLKANDGRIMISPWDVKMLDKIKQNIQSHKLAGKIIETPVLETSKPFLDKPEPGTIIHAAYHEFHINWEYPVVCDIDIGQHETERSAYTIKCKSLLDGITLDFRNKIVTIYDLKTTQKLWHFEDSIIQYDYLRQLAYYTMAVCWYLKNEVGENPDEWTFEYYIIGIDTTGSYEIRVFKIDEDVVKSRNDVIEKALHDIAWHEANDKWNHSREYYEGCGSEHLNL
jgi:hypothetical protein